MMIGYVRVSTAEQNTEVQLEAMRRAGVVEVHEEKQSAVKVRPVLDRLVATLQAGDVLVVYKLDRLARSMGQFVRLFEQLKAKGVGFKSLTESIETETAQGRMFMGLLAVFAEFERELIRERCHAGQIAARARGQTWGRVRSFTDEEARQVASIWREGWAQQPLLAEMFGVSLQCLREAIWRAEDRGGASIWWKRRGKLQGGVGVVDPDGQREVPSRAYISRGASSSISQNVPRAS